MNGGSLFSVIILPPKNKYLFNTLSEAEKERWQASQR
jgi:hypothetical protein